MTAKPKSKRARVTAPREELDVEALAQSIQAGQRRALAKGITLVENTRVEQRAQATRLISRLLSRTDDPDPRPQAGGRSSGGPPMAGPKTDGAVRIGISGVPGVGKSTFIEALGLHLIEQGHKLAILAVDPSSSLSGGSILGDKIRMERLAQMPEAFIRPSPTGGSLGGVARRTRESMLLCEAAGYDVIIVETVGVGQSETSVCDMVDFFLVLLLPNAGDEVQGLKKGIVEMADALVINKADGAFRSSAQQACRYYRTALHFLHSKIPGWQPPVALASAREGKGIAEVWAIVCQHREFMARSGRLDQLRGKQTQAWFRDALRDNLDHLIYGDEEINKYFTELTHAVEQGKKSPHEAADEVVRALLEKHCK